MIVYFDTETQLITPGCNAPPMACMSLCVDDAPATLLHWTEAGAWIKAALLGGASFVGANLSFDWTVIAANFPETLPLICKAYREDRCQDVLIRQKLLDVASGCYRGYLNSKWKWVHLNYDLASVTRRHSEMRLNKDDAIRLTYGALRDTPLAYWPEGHLLYALEDAQATRACKAGQDFVLTKNPGVPILADEYRQGRRDFALRLMSTWGLRTDAAAVDFLEENTRGLYEKLEALLRESGLVKPDGVRDTKAAKQRMLDVMGFRREGDKIVPLAGTPPARKIHLTDGGKKQIPDVSLAAEACYESDDSLLEIYGEFGELKSILSKDVKALRGGVEWPLHTHFGFAASGRSTSSNPNVQNWRRLPGIREAFRPRQGWVYAQADVEGLELATLAQTCIRLVGFSKLADALNLGLDPHTDLACQMMSLPYDEGKRRRKLGSLPNVQVLAKIQQHQQRAATRADAPDDQTWADYLLAKEFDSFRQMAKVANFGFPGGLGIKKMVLWAKTMGVILTEDQCRHLKEQWLAKWPEMERFFAYINSQMTNPDGTGTIIQLFSDRIRGGVTYTAACNTFFQGLGADATGAAAYELMEECYIRRESPMFGSRPVNYIHDEFIVETPDTPQAHDVAVRLEEIMVGAIKLWTPDIRISAPPLLMRYWSKDAKATLDTNGRLIPWA